MKLTGLSNGALALREHLAAVAQRHDPVLEIGPYFSPSLTGPNVYYADVLDREGLLKKATHDSILDTSRVPETIHYLTEGGDLGGIDQTFSAVFSAHCIEHQPDLVRHLQQVERLLKPNGRYFLVVPDKRFCFDHLFPPSGTDEVLEAVGNVVHPPVKVMEHFAFQTHNSAARHWSGDHLDESWLAGLPERVGVAAQICRNANGRYVDVHRWRFTPTSFRRIMAELRREKLVSLTVECVNETPFNHFEFTAILKRPIRAGMLASITARLR